MNTTQQHLSIADTKEGIMLLKDGGGALVLQVSAVNFGLLSEREQMGIIYAFAQMLNSLSFSLQIVIHSQRLNISSYLTLLDKAKAAQANPLLSSLMTNYRQFVQTTIKENEVLDKKFYVVIPLFKLELGLIPSQEVLHQKIKTVLLPRRDQILRQLSRVGLRVTQLDQPKLLELFYNIYNYDGQETQTSTVPVNLNQPKPTQPSTLEKPIPDQVPAPANQPPLMTSQSAKTHPFVVEELEE